MNHRPWMLVLLGALLTLGLAACGGSDATLGDGYVGAVDGTDAFIGIGTSAIAADGGETVVYVCNGDEGIAEWFRGTVDDPTSFSLTNAAGASVTAELGDGGFSGEFTTADGTPHGFTTTAIVGDAGVYRTTGPEAEAEGIVGGWIIDNDGNERGAIRRSGSFLSTTRFSRTFTFGATTFPVVQIIAPNNVINPDI